MRRRWQRLGRRLQRLPITVRITAAFMVAMIALLALTAVTIYERTEYSLGRAERDVPTRNRAEIQARREHQDEALHELAAQMAVAFVGTLAISGLVGYRVARAALDPVERLRRQAAEASADSAFRLPVPDTGDELQRLAETLNGLLSRVQDGVLREQRFVADASHELRTPLGRMVLQIDLALRRDRAAGELRAALVRLRDDAGGLVRLADDLLLLARADEGRLPLRPVPLDAQRLLADAADRFGAQARTAGRDIHVDAEPGLAVVADPDRIAQVLDNLVDNALRHGGGPVALRAARRDGRVELHVTDAGAGFPPGFAGRAFDRFATATTGRSQGGTGLGLAIVAAIAGAHGTHAGADTPAGGGADVWVELPAA
jgi:two-component system, OmpR family, sensor kinase